MEQREPIDQIFLDRLEKAYSSDLVRLADTVARALEEFDRDVEPDEHINVAELKMQIDDLRIALAEVQAELQRLTCVKQVHSTFANSSDLTSLDECNHWRQLFDTHIRIIRVLELDEAKMGNEFHYSKRIELDERRTRANELRQKIAANCP